MPPRRQTRRTDGEGAAGGRPAALASLPPDVLEMVAEHIVTQDTLNNPVTAAQDIASLAQTCRALNGLAKGTLWPALGAMYPAKEGARASDIAVVPAEERWEEAHLAGIKLSKMERLPTVKQMMQGYKEHAPKWVPQRVYAECERLRRMGTAATNAKPVLLLTDGELRELPHFEKDRGALGTAHVYGLTQLLRAAQRKHGSVEGLQAHAAQRASKAQQRKRKAMDSTQERRAALAAALARFGGTLTDAMCEIEDVAAHLKGGKWAPSQESLLPILQFADWATKHTNYPSIRTDLLNSESRWMGFKVMFRELEEMECDGYFGGNYFAEADKEAATLSHQEEHDCLNLACHEWAKHLGGVDAALARPEVPREGPLHEAIAAALRSDLTHNSAAQNLHMCDEHEKEEEEAHPLEQQQQQQQVAPLARAEDCSHEPHNNEHGNQDDVQVNDD